MSRNASSGPSLWLKLTAAFLLVALVGVALVAVLANQVTTSSLRRYMVQGQMNDAEELAGQLEALYAAEGNWDNAGDILSAGHGQGRGQGRGQTAGSGGGQLYIADPSGRIVTGAGNDQLGLVLSASTLELGTPLVVDGRQVGTLVLSNAWTGALGQIEEEFLQQVNQALVYAGLGAVGVALLIGTLLAWRIASPVRKLTQAAERVAAGDLNSRVKAAGRDEIGHLALAFNRMADNLEQSDELRRRMTADIAHELRTPLSIIRGQVEAIQDGIFPADAEHLEPIHDETLLLNRLVEDLRTLALAEAGQLPLHKEPVETRRWLERAAAGFRALAADKEVDLVLELAPVLPAVEIDTHRMEQVLRNLLANAIRHTPAGGRVTLHAKPLPHQRTLRVLVSDTGPGIPAEDQPHVFERFWRGDRSRTRDRGGAGLGLAISRQLVEAHDGRIWVESQAGAGTTFGFEVPAA